MVKFSVKGLGEKVIVPFYMVVVRDLQRFFHTRGYLRIVLSGGNQPIHRENRRVNVLVLSSALFPLLEIGKIIASGVQE
jgi:hypothetical protein